jgi:hypothetical protein
MDQEADAGDDHQHDGGQPVDGKIDADVQIAALDPGVIMLDVGGFERVAAEKDPQASRFSAPRQEGQQHEPTAAALTMAFEKPRLPKRPLSRNPPEREERE